MAQQFGGNVNAPQNKAFTTFAPRQQSTSPGAFPSPQPFPETPAFDPTQINQLIAQATQSQNQQTTDAINAGLTPFLQGQPGAGPLTQAAIEQFNISTRPIIEGQATLAGLGTSPALFDATGRALGEALPQFIQADLDNRFRAAQGLQAQQQLGLQGTQTGLEGAIAAGQLGIQGGELGLKTALGFGQLGLTQQQIDIDRELGFGQLLLAKQGQTFQQRFDTVQQNIDQEIAKGNLAVVQGQLQVNRDQVQGTIDQAVAELAATVGTANADRMLRAATAAAQVELGAFASNTALFEVKMRVWLQTINDLVATGADLAEIQDLIDKAAQAGFEADKAAAQGIVDFTAPGQGSTVTSGP